MARRSRVAARARIGELYRELHSAILSGALAPGERLPGESTLAAQVGISRNSVRGVLSRLAAEGLVETHAGRGSFVTVPVEPASRDHTLRLAMYYPSAQTEKLGRVVQAFAAQHPFLRVQLLQFHATGYGRAIASLMAAGQGPDLAVIMNNQFADLAPAEHFLPLEEFLASSWMTSIAFRSLSSSSRARSTPRPALHPGAPLLQPGAPGCPPRAEARCKLVMGRPPGRGTATHGARHRGAGCPVRLLL